MLMNMAVNKDDKIAIWGAGDLGKQAVCEIGAEDIYCVIDNNDDKIGKMFYGIPIISFGEFLKTDINRILITSYFVDEIFEQIKNYDYLEIDVYRPMLDGYGERNSFIQNTYAFVEAAKDEVAWNKMMERKPERHFINGFTQVLSRKKDIPLFDHVEIETLNRCNGTCSFCPVSVGNDTRKRVKMERVLFEKIINELSEMNYSGRLCLFSNNEPFLDERIIEFQHIAREKLPNARLHLFTNGSLLTVDKLKDIIPYLDELIIDNYNQNLQLNDSTKKIYEYCKHNIELMDKVTIALRKNEEILTSRGGNAPNRISKLNVSSFGCLLPFFQLIIRPDGKVSLCCNDALGESTLGDVSTQSIAEVWYGSIHRDIIKKISQGRGNIKQCAGCDAYNLAPRMKHI